MMKWFEHLIENTVRTDARNRHFVVLKVIMQGQLIAIAYTLRTYSLGGICKPE